MTVFSAKVHHFFLPLTLVEHRTTLEYICREESPSDTVEYIIGDILNLQSRQTDVYGLCRFGLESLRLQLHLFTG